MVYFNQIIEKMRKLYRDGKGLGLNSYNKSMTKLDSKQDASLFNSVTESVFKKRLGGACPVGASG